MFQFIFWVIVPFFENWSWAGAEFLGVSLVVTFVISRIFTWSLTKRLADRFSLILISNGLSLIICATVYGVLLHFSDLISPSISDLSSPTIDFLPFRYMPDFLRPMIDLLLPQGFCLLFDVISETRRLSAINRRALKLS
jgi:hypothetical protein